MCELVRYVSFYLRRYLPDHSFQRKLPSSPMNVSAAVAQRKSIRNFLDNEVSDELLRELLEKAKRAPSGGNLQPWQIYVVNGTSMQRLHSHLAGQTERETPAYDIYPANLGEPYRSRRFKVGEDMYALLGIPREDKAARFAHLARNFSFFGAPAGFFCYVDKTMGPPQWSDLGTRPNAVASFTGAPAEQMLFCGMAIGYPDLQAPVNTLVSDRDELSAWATFL